MRNISTNDVQALSVSMLSAANVGCRGASSRPKAIMSTGEPVAITAHCMTPLIHTAEEIEQVENEDDAADNDISDDITVTDVSASGTAEDDELEAEEDPDQELDRAQDE
jgi:hypothetical protein